MWVNVVNQGNVAMFHFDSFHQRHFDEQPPNHRRKHAEDDVSVWESESFLHIHFRNRFALCVVTQISVAGLLPGIRNNLPLFGGREGEHHQTHGPVPEFAMVNICIRLPAEQVFVSGCLQSRS